MQKVVVITGASKGIGLATIICLANAGYLVIGIARSKPKVTFPGELFSCDLSNLQATQEALANIKQKYQVNAIVNNVGIALPQVLGEIDLQVLQQVYDLNVRVAVQVTQAFMKSMQQQRYGRIINLASRAIFGVKARSSYAAAKSALIGLTKTWALELASFGITVNAIAPGPIETELFRESRPVGSRAEQEVLAKIPLARIGKPEEIAGTIKFLLSDTAAFITGQTICVDGGASL